MEIYFKKLTEDLLEVCRMLDDKPEVKNRLSEITFDVSLLPDTGHGFDKWTTEPPTQEGWYWAKIGEGIEIVLVEKSVHDSELLVYSVGDEAPDILKMFTHWLGPLPVPEPPTKGE